MQQVRRAREWPKATAVPQGPRSGARGMSPEQERRATEWPKAIAAPKGFRTGCAE